MLDYHALRTEVKASLLQRWQRLDIAADPLVWAWVAYAFSIEGVANNPLFGQAFEQARRWLASSEAWGSDGHLGSVGLLCALLRQTQAKEHEPIAPKLVERIQQLRERGLSKFSRLNDPDFVFGFTIRVGNQLPDEIRNWLRQHCERNAQPGNWRRGLLFAAAAQEIGGTIPPLVINGTELQVYEVFPALWFAERYPKLIEGEDRRRGLWEAFERIKEGVLWEAIANDSGALYVPSPIDAAMFYEVLLCQTRAIDPVTLFNNIPWHPEVRHSSESLFVKGEYEMAIFQAAIKLIDTVKNRTSHPVDKNGKPLDGIDLMIHAFNSKTPALKFNNLKSLAEQNEQRGLCLIAQGIVSAVRNPKGHVPKATLALGPYEALEQLAVISYLMRRLDSAHT